MWPKVIISKIQVCVRPLSAVHASKLEEFGSILTSVLVTR